MTSKFGYKPCYLTIELYTPPLVADFVQATPVCVDGYMDIEKVDNKYRFRWNGNDDSDLASGHGYFTHSGNTLTGRVCIYDGDERNIKDV